jgi:hypothetical protein
MLHLGANFYANILIGMFVIYKIMHVRDKIKNLSDAQDRDTIENIVVAHVVEKRYILNEVFMLLIIIFFWIIMQLEHFNFL